MLFRSAISSSHGLTTAAPGALHIGLILTGDDLAYLAQCIDGRSTANFLFDDFLFGMIHGSTCGRKVLSVNSSLFCNSDVKWAFPCTSTSMASGTFIQEAASLQPFTLVMNNGLKATSDNTPAYIP